MQRTAYLLFFLVLTLIVFGGCSSAPSSKEPAKAAAPPDKIQGKAQIALNETSSDDAAMNAGGPTVYLVNGMHRYRLFFNKPFQVDASKEYIAEGVNAQKAIDEMGDPDQGKNGYPLDASVGRVVRTAWPGLAFDATDGLVATLRSRIKRYPARPVFLVMALTPVTTPDKDSEAAAQKQAEEEALPEVSVPADKQKALLIEGPKSLPAPLFEPTATTTSCKVFIADGKILALDTGAQLCESVPWSQFRYQPTLKGGKPVKVKTEVAIQFEPRK